MATTVGLHTLPLSVFASQQTFRKIRLLARDKDDGNPRHFIQLANSNFSVFVREVTCDASAIVHNGVTYMEGSKTDFLPGFWDALPSLACFRSLRSLHVLFDTSFVTDELDYEPTDFRRRVLATIFRALAGTGTKVLQKAARNALSDDVTHPTAHQVRATPPAPSTSPTPLSTLIISNLEDFHDSRLTDIPEFTTIMSGVRALRLDIAQRKKQRPATSITTTGVFNQCREMFVQLPHTWLSLPVAANLQVLSLYYDSWWGWLPSFDFRLIDGGKGMPKLRTLASGHFVFSYEWQVDWITSLSLKELYLEECAVLAQYLDYPTTQEGYWTNGHESPNAADFVGVMKSNPLRWDSIYSRIRGSMATLRVLRTFGKPDLGYVAKEFIDRQLSDTSRRDSDLSIEENRHFITIFHDTLLSPCRIASPASSNAENAGGEQRSGSQVEYGHSRETFGTSGQILPSDWPQEGFVHRFTVGEGW
ncbi:hypothetical protein FSARC_2340 [Fusarium sarcochroum]|uniref:Uncharacterized protein n=1 Tax=Fusarium sarcochroum TaxID=1208366 RepID=A0A8H4U701_9HYPO|nr:hypothetical protein FSARC_2340 [Fusarium sarcochroum]